jgi:hypothetical protein
MAPAQPTPLSHGPTAPLPPALPEAAFSLCLRGRLGGQDAQLTVRGGTYAEFAAGRPAHAGGVVCGAWRADDPAIEPARHVVQPQDDRGLVQGQVTTPGAGALRPSPSNVAMPTHRIQIN